MIVQSELPLFQPRGVYILLVGKDSASARLVGDAIATRLARRLMRVDLRSLVSKYIGETERNLQRIFDAAERSGAVLLFEEADALFGKRTNIKDSGDRYANIEVNYFLERFERYAGVAILAVGEGCNLDDAFVRRMSCVVPVPPRRIATAKRPGSRKRKS